MVEYGQFGLRTGGIAVPVVGPDDYLYRSWKKLAEVVRFMDEKIDRLFRETDEDHVQRMKQRVREWPFYGKLDGRRLDRIFDVHDIGEIEKTYDVNGVKKALDAGLAQKAEVDEVEVAKRWLNHEDMELYLDYEAAGQFWKGKRDSLGISSEALVAYLVDKVDGNLSFHWRFRQNWGTEALKIYPDVTVLEHTFVQAQRFYERVGQVADKRVREWTKYIIDDELGCMAYLWKDVPREKVPVQIREGLEGRHD